MSIEPRLPWLRERDHGPAEQLRELLTEHKRAGTDFDEAWQDALPRLTYSSRREATAWRRVLTDEPMKLAWWAAYTDTIHPGLAFTDLERGWEELEAPAVDRGGGGAARIQRQGKPQPQRSEAELTAARRRFIGGRF